MYRTKTRALKSTCASGPVLKCAFLVVRFEACFHDVQSLPDKMATVSGSSSSIGGGYEEDNHERERTKQE